MAKSSTPRSGGTSRIRFVMVDAEIADGDIGQITQAIQNALRGPGTPTVVKRIAAPTPPIHNGAEAPELEVVDGKVDDAEEVEAIDVSPQPARQRGTRKPSPTPDPIPIEKDQGVTLAAFAKNKDVKSQHKKYLIAAAWLKEHRGIDVVTPGHIYTCFRFMDWPTNILDFAQPLRDLKAKKYFVTKEKGSYAINHIGLDYVKKLGGDGTS